MGGRSAAALILCLFVGVSGVLVASDARAQSGQFEFSTFSAGFGGLAASNGVAVADYNRDGLLDVYVVVPTSYEATNSRTWNRLFAGLGGGSFADMTRQARVAGRDIEPQYGSSFMGSKLGASWGDYDNDGYPDLYLTHFGPDQLFHNNGNGTFTEVTEETGVAGGESQMSTSALWFDCDDDGDLDLYVGVWGDFPQPGQPGDSANRLYENLGDGVFEDVSVWRGVADYGKTFTTLPIDVNGDGRLDLYNANDFGRNLLFVQEGDCTFREATKEYGLEDPAHGMGLALGDPNGDGRFDIFVTNISGEPAAGSGETHSLFVAREDGTFENTSADAGVATSGWGWGVEFFDMENDGDDDLLVGEGYFEPNDRNELYENRSVDGILAFENVSEPMGVADVQPARGLAVFDYDEDGRLDLLISNFLGAPYLYRNRLSAGSWLSVRLEGTASNRNAFGAMVEVYVGSEGRTKSNHGAQFLGQNIIPLHFGLGNATVADRVVVRWPSGHVDEIGALVANQSILVRETEGLVDGIRATEVEMSVPAELRLVGNYPNPFRRETRIQFVLPAPASITVGVFDALGRKVDEFHRSFTSPGLKSVSWSPGEQPGRPPGVGLYLYEIRVDGKHGRRLAGTMLYLR
jgi:hypothetical protein